MKRIYNRIKKGIKESDKTTLTVYIILRLLVILCMIRELFHGNIENALLCILLLILFLFPAFVEKTFKIDLPGVLEVIILIFIFSAEILGEINNFYGIFSNFDDILHTLNGFLAASVGFSLVYLLNENIESFKLSPIFVTLVAFCFSMTIGVVWEFFEYGMDVIFKTDMQKDKYVYNINTVELDPEFDNNVVSIENINKIIVYDKKGNILTNLNGYLDIGLHDTMNDLKVNFIGALIYSIFGYLYIINKEKYKFAGRFLTRKKV
ncbi:MAG: hypothetical protein IJO32_01910 [Bacilli bacterium]|nr:hypothetical protein [Bacilli bacterium]